MADFTAALQEGLKAAEASDRARKEIDRVFEELNTQLAKATDNAVLIERVEWPVPGFESSWRLVATNPSIDESPALKLAGWNQDRAGYPCSLSWAGEQQFCEDKGALQQQLADLLKDPLVGESIHTLMHLPVSE